VRDCCAQRCPPRPDREDHARAEESLARDLAALPDIPPAYKRLNLEEPYRLKATCIRQKLLNTRKRIAEGTPARARPDYLNGEELVADLLLMRDSLLADRGG
jgi:phosphoenolpyruvate carboxylase